MQIELSKSHAKSPILRLSPASESTPHGFIDHGQHIRGKHYYSGNGVVLVRHENQTYIKTGFGDEKLLAPPNKGWSTPSFHGRNAPLIGVTQKKVNQMLKKAFRIEVEKHIEGYVCRELGTIRAEIDLALSPLEDM